MSASAGAGVILVAEDSMTMRATLRHHLVGRGYEVVEAVDGADALAVVRQSHPDVVLLDVEMPGIDGHAVLAEMQRDPALSGIPVVFLTGRTDTDEVVDGLQAGAHDYLRKPFEAAELVARVSAAVRVKRLQDELEARYEELSELSRLDALTGLFNRGHVEERLRDLCSASTRHGFPMTVMILDVDHFKVVNDTHGHPTGDKVLRTITSCISVHLRAEDIPGRWGGEELVVLLPYVPHDGAVAVAERIRCEIERAPMVSAAGAAVRVTASAGLCTGVGCEPEALLARADEALYRAKSEGRNQVVSCTF